VVDGVSGTSYNDPSYPIGSNSDEYFLVYPEESV